MVPSWAYRHRPATLHITGHVAGCLWAIMTLTVGLILVVSAVIAFAILLLFG
jgi:hypothetical protein